MVADGKAVRLVADALKELGNVTSRKRRGSYLAGTASWLFMHGRSSLGHLWLMHRGTTPQILGVCTSVALPWVEVNHIDIAILMHGDAAQALGLQALNIR